MPPLLIGFGHRMLQGKDFCVKAIIGKYGTDHDIRRYGFADALKREVAEASNLPNFSLNDTKAVFDHLVDKYRIPEWVQYDSNPPKDDPFCPAPLYKQRTLLQWWGTEYRRAHTSPYYWINQLARAIHGDDPQVALIADVRFRNEVGWIRGHGGVYAKVERVGYDRDSQAVGSHVSESELDDVLPDYCITAQDGDLDGLRKKAWDFFGMIAGEYLG